MSLSNNFPTIRPSLLLDFANVGRLDPRVTFTRASTATYFDQLGVLQSAANDAPRFDYNPSTLQPRGLLIEEQRTNSIRNNTMQGAVAGSPGTLPTNWAWSGTTAGLTVEVIGTGVESGITYIDLKMSGTADGTSFTLGFEPSSIVTASSGQTWTLSTYSRIVGGSLSNIVYNLSITEQNGGSVLTSGALAVTPTTDPLNSQRFSFTRTLVNASTNNIRPRPRFDTTAGAVDLTLRIGLPQLEQGAFATSVIPTTTTALTRNADVASMTGTNFSSWYNASEGTLFGEGAFLAISNSQSPYLVSIGDPSLAFASRNISASINGQASTANVSFRITSAGTNQLSVDVGSVAAATAFKSAIAYGTDNGAASLNGSVPTTDTSVTVPAVTTLILGDAGWSAPGGTKLNGWIARIAYYPTRLTNAQLQALTG